MGLIIDGHMVTPIIVMQSEGAASEVQGTISPDGEVTEITRIDMNVSFPGIKKINIDDDTWLYFDFNDSQAGRVYQVYRTIVFPDLEEIEGVSHVFGGAFQECSYLTGVTFPRLRILGGQETLCDAYNNCESSELPEVLFPLLEEIRSGENEEGAMRSCFYSSNLTTTSFPSLTTINGNCAMDCAFQDCENLTTASFPSLTAITGSDAMRNAFQSCTSLTSVDLSSLTTISGVGAFTYAFENCTDLISVDFSSLTTISADSGLVNAFTGCTGLTSMTFPSLSSITESNAMQDAFENCTSLTTLSFPSLTSTAFGSNTDQFNDMLHGVTGCTVHFPSNLQSVIGEWSDVTAGFGGTNTTVLFDLPATT